MVDLLRPLSLWIQLGSFFMFLSGIFADLLVIRLCLSLGYLMILVNASLGSPLWPDIRGMKGAISLDGLIWSLLGFYVHGCSMVWLLLDERKVDLDDDKAALWRMLYRTGGLSQRLFHTILACCLDVVEFQPEESIPTDEHIYILYHGQAHLEVFKGEKYKSSRILVSGDVFDIKHLGMFAEDSHFNNHSIRCTSITKTKLFRMHRTDIRKISQNSLAKSVLQTLLINNLSFVVASYVDGSSCRSFLGDEECDKIFLPLEPWEEPKQELSGSGQALNNALGHLIAYLTMSYYPPWPFAGHPTGIRQTQLPPPPYRPQTSETSLRFSAKSILRVCRSSFTKASSSFKSSNESDVCDDKAANTNEVDEASANISGHNEAKTSEVEECGGMCQDTAASEFEIEEMSA